jgi:diguanylate cyclase (GGDEF)-like protein/PAS domain S-box-containing protein
MRGVKTHLFIIIVIAIFLALGVWVVQTKIANNVRADVGRSLTIVRDTTHQALKIWFKDQKAAAVAWADDPKIREYTERLLALSPHQSTLQDSPDQQALRAWFLRMQKATHYRGYFVVGPNQINLASSRDQNIGVESLLVGQEDFLAGIWAGRTAISLPTRSDVPLTDSHGRLVSGLPSMFVATPIRNDADEVMAIFMFLLDPEEGFTNILKRGRIGNTGETYAFDSKGRLISQSRFDDRLQEIGLIPAGEHGMLNLLIRDPGENLIEGGEAIVPRNQQPLTHMAKSAIRGEAGIDVNGYRDYRGVPVVGAWMWDTELGLGISTELDVQEAYQTLNATHLTIVTLTVFTLFLLTGATVIYTLYRQRKQTEVALRESNLRYSLATKTTKMDIFDWDIEKDNLVWDDGLYALHGVDKNDFTGAYQAWVDRVHPDDIERAQLEVEQALRGEKDFDTDFRLVHPDGTIKYVQACAVVLRDEAHKPVRMIGLNWDITERKQAEEELRRAATVFDNTDEAIIVTNAERDIVLVNKAFTVITGYKPDDVLGKNPRLLKSGRHDVAFYQTMWDTLKRDDQWRGEIWDRCKNGDVFPAWENINVVRDEQGRIINYVAIFTDISILKEPEERLAHQAHHDALTGLPNRLRFIANLEQAIESAKRHNQKVALMFLDLDRFKHINDTFGHDVGDQLLKTIAERLKSCVRAEDTVARLGGDEFTVVLTEVVEAEDAGLIADKIVKIVRKPVTLDTHTIDTSTSVGISIFPDDAVDSEGMVKAADTAMYHAKAMGKNSFQFITAELALRTLKHVQIEQGLRKAIENKEFELYYQPQINLNDGKVAGVEALIRWNHPDHGQLLPKEFIHVADDSDLMNAITNWILHTALSDYEYWSNNGSIGPRIAVNVTGRQITSEPSTKCLLNVLEELKSESSTLQLDLEITETTLESTERTIDIINTLKDLGVMFAIDDFGTGHSSLSRLKQLPVDALKIDQSFISKIADEGDDKAIVAAIIAMAHSLGLRVIAEGVETRSQLDVLQALDCDEIQGFYFSKPVPASEIPRLLEKSFL